MEERPTEIATVSSPVPSSHLAQVSPQHTNLISYIRNIPGIRAQLFATLAMSVCAFVGGTASAWPRPMILVLTSPESPVGQMNSDQTSLLVTCMQLSSIITLAVTGVVIDGKGRQWSCMMAGFVPPISWMVLTFAREVQTIFIGAALLGAIVTFSLTMGVSYLCETSNDKIRGATISLMMFSFSFGEMMTHIFGEYMSYVNYHIFGLVTSLFPFLFVYRLPESPQYLMLEGKLKEARESVVWFYGDDPQVVEEEMKKLKVCRKRSCDIDKFRGGNLRAMIITLFLFTWCELAGTTLIETYSEIFLASASDPILAGHATVILAVCRFVAGIISCYLVEKMGRRRLIISNLMIMGVMLALISVFYAIQNYGFDAKFMLGTFMCLVIYIVANEMFVATAETISGEVVSPEVRGWVLSLAGCFRVLTVIATLQMYPPLWEMTHFTLFFFFSFCSFLGSFISIRIIPETKGKSLAEVNEIINFSFRRKSYKWKVEHV